MAHLRHRQGRRLPRRPGRGGDPRQGGHRRGHRPREHGPPLQPHAGRQDRPAPVRRPHGRPRQEPRPPLLLRSRPHGPHDPADAVPELRQVRHQLLQRVLRARPRHGGGRREAAARGRRGPRAVDRRDPRLPVEGRDLRDRRLRQDLQDDLERAHAHGRRRRDHLAQGPAARGHGVLPVPPDRPRRPRHPPVGGGTRRGRDPPQQRGRALHGAVRPHHQGPRAA